MTKGERSLPGFVWRHFAFAPGPAVQNLNALPNIMLLCRAGISNVTCRFRELTMVSGVDGTQQSPAWAPCTSPKVYEGLAQGRYGLTLRAADDAGLINKVRQRENLLLLISRRGSD